MSQIWLNGETRIKLDELSLEDILFFLDERAEKIVDLKPEFGEVYTQSTHYASKVKREKEITTYVYELNSSAGIISANSKGRIMKKHMEKY